MSVSSQVAQLENGYADLVRLTGFVLATLEVNIRRNIIVTLDGDGKVSNSGMADLGKLMTIWAEEFAIHEKRAEDISASGLDSPFVHPRAIYVADVQ